MPWARAQPDPGRLDSRSRPENEDQPKILDPPPPRRLAGPGWTPRRSAPRRPGLGPGPGSGGDGGGDGGGSAPGRRRASSPRAEAGGRAAAAPLSRRGSGSAACRGRGWAGPPLNSFQPDLPAAATPPQVRTPASQLSGRDALGRPGQISSGLNLNNGRELRADGAHAKLSCPGSPLSSLGLSVEGRAQKPAGFLGSRDQRGRNIGPSGPVVIRGSPATCPPSWPAPRPSLSISQVSSTPTP